MPPTRRFDFSGALAVPSPSPRRGMDKALSALTTLRPSPTRWGGPLKQLLSLMGSPGSYRPHEVNEYGTGQVGAAHPGSTAVSVVRDGVCLFFENSTVCCFVSAMFVCVVCASDQCGICSCWGGCCFLSIRHSMESLILAQDERWRRA